MREINQPMLDHQNPNLWPTYSCI